MAITWRRINAIISCYIMMTMLMLLLEWHDDNGVEAAESGSNVSSNLALVSAIETATLNLLASQSISGGPLSTSGNQSLWLWHLHFVCCN
jgi:hypothetical protein